MATSLASRLRQLVEERHRGSTNAAAKAIGIPQSTLWQMIYGRTKKPHAATIQKIAAFYQTSAKWLLTGRGEPPPPFDGELLRWWRFVGDLHLPKEIVRALHAELLGPAVLHELMLQASGVRYSHAQHVERSADVVRKATGFMARASLLSLRDLLERYGPEGLVDLLRSKTSDSRRTA